MAFRSAFSRRHGRRRRRLAPFIVSRPMATRDVVSSALHFDATTHWHRRYLRRGIRVGYQDADRSISGGGGDDNG